MPAQCTTKPLEYEGCDPPGARASRPQPYSCKQPAVQGHSLVKRTNPPGARASRPQPYSCKQPAIQGHSLAKRSKPPGARASRPQPCSCEQPAVQGQSLAQRTKPAFAVFVTIVPSRVRARRPRSRVGVSPATLFLQAACGPGPLPRKAHQTGHREVRYHCAKSCAGETPALPGGARPQAYSRKQPAIQGHCLARCTKPAIARFVSIVPSRVRARRPRSRVGVSARNLIPASSLRSKATPPHSAPNRPSRGSFPLCQVVCGRDARAPGWASPPATLFLQAACDAGPIPRTVHQTHPCGLRFHCAKSCAGETPALPGGSHPQAYSRKQPPIHGQPLGGKTFAIALSGSISDWVGNR